LFYIYILYTTYRFICPTLRTLDHNTSIAPNTSLLLLLFTLSALLYTIYRPQLLRCELYLIITENLKIEILEEILESLQITEEDNILEKSKEAIKRSSVDKNSKNKKKHV